MNSPRPRTPPTDPVPVIDTAAKAIEFLWRGRGDFMTLAFPAIVVLSIVRTVLAQIFPAPMVAPDVPPGEAATIGLGNPVVILLTALASFYFWTTFAVAWLRRYLLPKEPWSIGEALQWRSRHSRVLLYLLGFSALFAVAAFIGVTLGGLAAGIFLALVVIGFLYARLSLVFPGAAVDHALTFGESWMLTRGNTARLFALFAAVWLVTLIGTGGILQMLGLVLVPTSFMGEFVVAFVANVLGYLSVALSMSILAIVYDRLRTKRSPSVNVQVF